MKYIGAHVSASGGVENAVLRSVEIERMLLRCLLKINVNGKPRH